MKNRNQYTSKYGINKEWKRSIYGNNVDKVQSIPLINKESKEIIDPDYIPIWKKKNTKKIIHNESIIMTIITKEYYEHFSNLLNFIKKKHLNIVIEYYVSSIKIINLNINYILTIIYQPINWFMTTNIKNVHNIFSIKSYSKNYIDTYQTIVKFIHK